MGCESQPTENVLDGSVDGHNLQRHGHQEFIRFLNAVEAELPQDKPVHAILDNYATHKIQTPGVANLSSALDIPPWADIMSMAEHSRGVLFAKLTRRRLKNGVFHSIVNLQAAANRFIKEHNQEPCSFAWRADADEIITAGRGRACDIGSKVVPALFTAIARIGAAAALGRAVIPILIIDRQTGY